MNCDQTILNNELIRRGGFGQLPMAVKLNRTCSTLQISSAKNHPRHLALAMSIVVGVLPYTYFPRGESSVGKYNISANSNQGNDSEWAQFRSKACLWHMLTEKSGLEKVNRMKKDEIFSPMGMK